MDWKYYTTLYKICFTTRLPSAVECGIYFFSLSVRIQVFFHFSFIFSPFHFLLLVLLWADFSITFFCCVIFPLFLQMPTQSRYWAFQIRIFCLEVVSINIPRVQGLHHIAQIYTLLEGKYWLVICFGKLSPFWLGEVCNTLQYLVYNQARL